MVALFVPIVALLSFAFTIVAVTRIVSDGRTRRRLIDKGATSELLQAAVAPPRQDPLLYDSLKWALVTGAVGLGLVVIQFLPYERDEPIMYGVVLLFGAVGLLGYYAVARRLVDR